MEPKSSFNTCWAARRIMNMHLCVCVVWAAPAYCLSVAELSILDWSTLFIFLKSCQGAKQYHRVRTSTQTHAQDCADYNSPTNYVGSGVKVSWELACASHEGKCAQYAGLEYKIFNEGPQESNDLKYGRFNLHIFQTSFFGTLV